MKTDTDFSQFALAVPEILLPCPQFDLQKWAVIACDQYTQNKDYWNRVTEQTAKAPSTFHLTLPEIFLGNEDCAERQSAILRNMEEYQASGVFSTPVRGFVYTERKTAYNRLRKGIVAALDLERYEWKPFNSALIRATEATIVERLPPRMEIREQASLELPHIMMLINDPEHIFIEETGRRAKKENTPLYCTDLMQDSGSISGWAVQSAQLFTYMTEALGTLLKAAQSASDDPDAPFLFAAGDGNHSLASAKAVWDKYKKTHPTLTEHPLRYALVEIVNLYDEGLTFEPIHRVLFDTDTPLLINYLRAELDAKRTEYTDEQKLCDAVQNSSSGIGFVYTTEHKAHFTFLEADCPDLIVSYLQPVLDLFINAFPDTGIDFIHGNDEVCRLGRQPRTAGILLSPIAKETFFTTVNSCGILPRKSFSMGEASEKRFYIECRKIRAD